MFVKICGITNEDDALLSVAMGADAVGFIFAPSSRQVAPQKVYDITRRLPPEILTVGVFRDELPARVVELAHKAGVKAVQLHGRETPEQAREIAGHFPLGDQGIRRSDDDNLPKAEHLRHRHGLARRAQSWQSGRSSIGRSPGTRQIR